MKNDPPRFKPNHYSGAAGFANYGYVLINGKWVDPDSEGEVFDAIKSHANFSQSQNVPIKLTAPSFMDPDQARLFYQNLFNETAYLEPRSGGCDFRGDFMEDNEGDSRVLRISPATFARWAVGAGRGDSYVGTKVAVEVREPRPD
jgi:hypothetical protein